MVQLSGSAMVVASTKSSLFKGGGGRSGVCAEYYRYIVAQNDEIKGASGMTRIGRKRVLVF